MSEEANEDQSPRTAADVSASVFDFVNDFLDDQTAGIVRDLAAYQSRFPGAEAEIAEEFTRLTNPDMGVDNDPGDERFVQHYKLIRELGRGGQGSVWLAEDQNLRRLVALKLLNSWLIAGERMARFQREAESIARLEHEGLAVVYEAQMDSDPPFIAMRFVEGEDLSTCLSNRQASPLPFLPINSPRKLRAALHFFERAARALHVAHEAGVVHRDIKPGNILIAPNNHPVITDFGLARDEFSPGEESITQEGEVFGTPAYMSPEQVGGRAEDVDRRTDIWSLGATLYETLCGAAPFQGKGQLGLARAIMEAPLSLPQTCDGKTPLPTDVRVVLQTAMERDLGRRYPTALAMAEDLRRIREFEPIQARPAGPWLKLRRWGRREPAWAAALGLLLITLTGGLIVSQFTIDRIQGLLEDKEVALNQERALRYVRQVPTQLLKSPSTALAAGLEAVSLHDSWITRSSLYGPLENLTLRARGKLASSNVAWSCRFLGDGKQAILASGSGGLTLIRSDDGTPITSRIFESLDGSKAPNIRLVVEIPGQDAVLIGTSDGRVLRLSLPGLETVWQVSLSKTSVTSIALFPDGQHVVALTGDGGADKLNAKNGAKLLNIPVPAQSAAQVLVLPDARSILTSGNSIRSSASPTPRATLWDATSGVALHQFLHSSAVRCAAIHPSGSHLATGTLGGKVYLWDLAKPNTPPMVRQVQGSIECMDFSPDGKRLAVGGVKGAWIGNALESTFETLLGHNGEVVDLEFSHDSEELATCALDNVVRVFRSVGGKSVRDNRTGYRPLLVAWSPVDHRLMSAGIDKGFSLWNPSAPMNARRLQGLGDPITWTGFTSDGEGAIAVDSKGRVLLFKTPRAPKELRACKPPSLLADHKPGPVLCAVASGAQRAVSGGLQGKVILHDLDKETVLAVHGGWVQGIRHLAIRPDGNQVAIVDGIGRLGLWDGKEEFAMRPKGVQQQIQRVCFDSSGKLLAAGDALGQVLVWDTETGDLLYKLTAEWSSENQDRHPVIDLDFGPEGRTVHAASAPWWVLSWDLSAQDKVAVREKRMSFNWLRALPRNLGVVTCGTGRSTFSVGSSGKLSRPANRHVATLTCMDVNTAGELAATGCEDGSVLVWNVVSGATVAQFDQHGGPVRHIAFSPIAGDNRVLSASDDGTLALWPVDPTATAEASAPHRLTDRYLKRFDSWGLAPESR